MHARLDQLLSLRDGEPVDAAVPDHVARCASCASELTRIATTREQLKSLPIVDAPQELWIQICERVSQRGPRRSTVNLTWVGAVAAAAIVLAVAISFFQTPDKSRIALQSPSKSEAELSTLVERSQQLEAMLDTLPQRPSVERVATATNIDGIQDRIQWLDFHLSAANDALNQAQVQQLWRERVNLMDSLVKLRYAEARTAQL